ncbi:MAG: FHA domain-containing protein, partial [Bdellovibrionota bacterium]
MSDIKKDLPKSSPRSPAPGGARKLILLASGEKSFRLDKERLVIGSVISADVRILGDGVEPLHAVLEISSDAIGGALGATIYDLASDSGVFINGKKVVSSPLKSGDEITIGRHKLRFSLEDRDKGMGKDQMRVSNEGRKLFINPDEDLRPLLLQDEREVHEIFDYRPTHKQALEVVMSWKGTILAVEHFVSEKNVTVGAARRSDFGIPPLLTTKTYAIVTRQGDGFSLNLDPQMSGVMHRQAKLQTLDEVRLDAVRGASATQVPIAKDDFAKVKIGEIDFYFSYTAAPPRLKRRKLFDHDPLFVRILGTSLLLTAVTIAAMLNTRVPQSLEAEQVPERIATILYQPERTPVPVVKETFKPVPVVEEPKTPPVKTPPPKVVKIDVHPNPAKEPPKKVPAFIDTGKQNAKHPKSAPTAKAQAHPSQKQGKEGEGAKHTGKSGGQGEKNAKIKMPVHQTKASRPGPHPGPGAGGGHSQVPDIGNVDFLKGASSKVLNILGNSAEKLGKGGERLKGYGNFSTVGEGGLALSGGGRGGGGDAASMGLGSKGTGGGAVGTGKGAVGTGDGIIGGKARLAAIRRGGAEESIIMGAIDKDAVEAAILAHKDEFRLCFEREVNAENPKLGGT